MKLHRILLSLLFIATTALVTAQNLSVNQLVGNWKLSGAVIEGVKFDFKDKEAMMASAFAAGKKMGTNVKLTKEDSLRFESTVMDLFNGFSSIYFNFSSNGTFEGKFISKGEAEDFKGVFSIKRGLLALKENGSTREDLLEVKFPDTETIVLKKKGDDQFVMTLSKQ